MGDLRLRIRGPWSLASVADEGGGLDLAFPVEGSWRTVGARVHEHDGLPALTVTHNPGRLHHDTVRDQVERILSVDVDGSGLAAVGDRDEVAGALLRRYPGRRPVGFCSPYEAAAWALLTHRVRMSQAAAVRDRLAGELGEEVDRGDGRSQHASPTPERLADLQPVRGLSEQKVQHLRGLGRAAAAGELDAAALRALPTDQALHHLQRLPGVGPFSAELVLVRGAGAPDVFPRAETRLHGAMAGLYDVDVDADDRDALQRLADTWRPYRCWVAVLLRTWREDVNGEIAAGRRAHHLPGEVAADV